MRGQEMLEILENLKPEYVEAAQNASFVKRTVRLKKYIAIAACLIVIVSASMGTFAYATEVREYKEAVRFFENYSLSTEGLTRGEMKMIYRDIETKSFSYDKTAQVIWRSFLSGDVAGYEIIQSDLSPDEVENMWNCMNFNMIPSAVVQEGVSYDCRNEYGDDCYGGINKGFAEKYDGETLVWSVPLEGVDVRGCTGVSDGVIVYGETILRSEEDKASACMLKLDENGNMLWKKVLENGFEWERIAFVIENSDGSYAVLSRGDYVYFCLSRYTVDGERTLFSKTDVGNYGIWNAIKAENGYIVQLGSVTNDEFARIIKVDNEGNITDSFSYGDSGSLYYINDMIEFNGNIYLSGYAVPEIAEDESDAGGRDDVASVLNYIHEKGLYKISSEELTPLVKKNFTAVLLVCECESGAPKEFFSVEGSVGGTLRVNASGVLSWDVGRIERNYYSPMTSSYTIGGVLLIHRYNFDEAGTLISCEATGKVDLFRR